MKMIFKSLLSNETAITGARKRKWWIALLILLVSLLFSVIPSFVQFMTTKGSQLISNGAYGIDVALTKFVEEKSGNVKLTVVEGNKTTNYLVAEGFDSSYVYKFKESDSDIDAAIYYVEECSTADFVSLCGTKTATTIVFSKTDFFIDIVNPETQAEQGSLACLNAWKDFKVGTELLTYFKGDSDASTLYSTVYSNLKGFLDKTYNYQRVTSSFVQTGLMAGVNLAVTALMGLMIFLLTRGKQNVFRIFTFWDTQKIAYWVALAPAVLAVPLGFLISRFANLWFVLLIGIRAMWCSSKQLRPDGVGYEEPKEQVKTVNVKSK